MRISSIQNYYRTNYTNRTSRERNFVAEQNMQTNPQNLLRPINIPFFTGIQSTSLQLAKKIPLEDRLASVFEITKHGDLVITGKNLKSAQKALKESVKAFNHAIKRFIFVEDDNIDGTAAFFRNFKDELEITNTNKFDILYNYDGELLPVKPGETYYATPGDTLRIKNTIIPIKGKPDTDLSLSRHIFSKSFDLTDSVNSSIEKRNMKSIQALSQYTAGVKQKKLTFADVGGQDNVINELKKGILYPVKYPEAYENSIVNHGFIMYGPPGTGKTLIAQALANESKADFVKLNGLEMESKWVGQSEENWRNLFDQARENQPSIIFIDEFDAVAKKRGGADIYGDKVVNQLLTLMSDVEKNGDAIYVIAATNKLDALDSAITRSGRFGKHIEVKAPDTVEGINKILDIHTKNKKLSPDVDKVMLSKRLLDKQTTGADIAFIVNNAHENAFERAGIYTKMENGTFEKSDIDNLKITNEDFAKAIKDFVHKNDSANRRLIGFNKR